MAYRNLIIPGHTTALDDHPEFQVIALSNQPLTVMIKYLAEKTPERTVFGEITFISVLEYCWTAYFVEYEDIREHESDYEFGLIEILDSRYVENMASKTQLRNHPGLRFGLGIKEENVKHYRIGFDNHGQYDVIALGVSIKEISSDTSVTLRKSEVSPSQPP